MITVGAGALHQSAPEGGATPARRSYRVLLTWAFTTFNSVRMRSYLPTVWAIRAGGASSQHSLWTWITWPGANATMAAGSASKAADRSTARCWSMPAMR